MAEIQQLRDEELVTIIRDKNQELYTEIVKRYEEKLKRYALVFVHDNDQAEDVLQITFIKAFENLKSFNIKKKFSSWIYRILHNEAINYIKKHKREVSLDDSTEAYKIASDVDHNDEIEKEEVKTFLNEHMDKLSIKYREPLALFYLDEYSYEEISEILRMPVGTVGTRVSRGRILLKKSMIKEYGKKQPTTS